MYLVSIIIPVYNRCNVIRKSYQSLINQTYQNLEIIFVNDGSTDNSLEVLKQFNDKRVKVINQDNLGPLTARINGLKASSGKYICFVDSDDTLNKDYISKLVNTINLHHSNIAIARLGIHYDYPFIKKMTLKAKRKPKKIDLSKQKEYLPSLAPGLVGKLFKREFLTLKKVEFLANEDLIFMYPIYINSRYISFVNNTTYHYHLTKNNQFKEYLLGYSFEHLKNTFEPLRYMYEEIETQDELENYFSEVEMLFIKNISERIWNIMQSVPDKIYRYKFISCILDYLECFFPDWDKNPYYVRGFKLGEVSDIYHIRISYEEIKKIKRKKLYLTIDEVYKRYQKIENMYNKSK